MKEKFHRISPPLEISQNSQENTCAEASFLIKLQALACNFIKKRLWHMCSSERAIWFSDKEFKEREREREREREKERDLKSTAADRHSISISYIIMRSSGRYHSIDVLDNIYGYLPGLSCRCFLKIMNILDRSDSASSFFTTLRSSCSWICWNFQKNTQEK